jgi:hypothetical protein
MATTGNAKINSRKAEASPVLPSFAAVARLAPSQNRMKSRKRISAQKSPNQAQIDILASADSSGDTS